VTSSSFIPQDEVDLYAVRAQYERGWIFGEEVKGYREEENVAPIPRRRPTSRSSCS
jgi:glucose-6-phosphate 1-dehydrogenase